ncbi:MAG: hypothetical protein K0S98_1037 [Propionibacteriaceae bacterium]|nr:hypothetical protein [Propionibacteriaceae bacterium]
MPAVAVLRAVLAVVPAIARDPAQDSYRDLLIMAVPQRFPAEIPPGQPTRGGSVGRCSDNRVPPRFGVKGANNRSGRLTR